MTEHTELVRLLASVLTSEFEGSLPERLCTRAMEVLDMDGLVVTVLSTPDHRHVVCASDDDAVQADDVQFTLGDGPVVEAFRDRSAVLVADLPNESLSRWPLYGEAAARTPRYSGVFAYPLVVGTEEPLGVMGLYRRRPGAMDDASSSQARLIADAMALAVVRGGEDDLLAGELDDGGLTQWSGAEQVVYQAVGMVVAQLRLDPFEALTRLRAHAFANNDTLDEVALAVVERRLRLRS